jgi:hypothetical protein
MKRYHVKTTYSVEAVDAESAVRSISAAARNAAAGVPTLHVVSIAGAQEIPDQVWNRYAVPAEVYITARSQEEARQLLIAMTTDGDQIEVLDRYHNACVYLGTEGEDIFLDSTMPRLQSKNATPPGGY